MSLPRQFRDHMLPQELDAEYWADRKARQRLPDEDNAKAAYEVARQLLDDLTYMVESEDLTAGQLAHVVRHLRRARNEIERVVG
jgi:hypothetical protein